ncbi:hypothetical protein XELAEV_18023271mg [Xenopus laevis]|uniref:Uncharacterized protein n=1 Tax=Xenopus laevis TaxID=8355 RepID=A0A974D6I1_XENLA|nr:hypothetical protein XELAEV_18023271mg [Xenopus laevis]
MGHLKSTSDVPLSSTALSPAVLSATVVPPVVPPLYPKYGVIHRNSFKPLGRPCIPFHSIPQTANAGLCRLPRVQWNGKECSFHHASLTLPYSLPPPSASLDSIWRIDRGSKSDRL